MLCWGPDLAKLLSRPLGLWLGFLFSLDTNITLFTQNISEPRPLTLL